MMQIDIISENYDYIILLALEHSRLYVGRVLYFSIHRYEYGTFWPSLRESDYDYIGECDGKGFNINVPLNKVSHQVVIETL